VSVNRASNNAAVAVITIDTGGAISDDRSNLCAKVIELELKFLFRSAVLSFMNGIQSNLDIL